MTTYDLTLIRHNITPSHLKFQKLPNNLPDLHNILLKENI